MINNMKSFVEIYQHEADEAARRLDARREEMRGIAVNTRDVIAEQINNDAQRADLVAIIETAIEGSTAWAAGAPLVIAQFITGHIQNPAVRGGDGAALLDVFTDAARDMGEAERRRALEAVLLSATGEADPGLMTFPKPWHMRASLATLRSFAAIIDKETYDEHADELAQLQADHATASRYADMLDAPVIITPTTKTAAEEQPELIAILNKSEDLPMTIAGVTMKGYGAITHVTPEQLEQFNESQLWRVCLATNSVEVMQP